MATDVPDMAAALSREDETEIKELLESGSYDKMAMKIKAKLSEWENIDMNIAVTGESGSGKSSFVNTIRGLTADDDGAAAVDVKETTLKPTAYPHPTYKKLVYWDLPGVGTLKFPIDKYFEEVQATKYDFFVIISSERFSSYDVALAREIKRLGRKFYFVRSKMYNDMRGAKKSHPKTFDAEKVMKTINADIVENLAKQNLYDTKVFLVDMYETSKFEFAKLTEAIARDLKGLAKEAFLFGINTCSKIILHEKEEFLKSRIWRTAALSAASSTVLTLPLSSGYISIILDTAVIMKEISFYRVQLGLDEESLRRLAGEINKDYEYLREEIETEPIRPAYVLKTLAETFSSTDKVMTFIPLLGSVWAGAASYSRTYSALWYSLEKLLHQADQLLIKAFEEV